jgi:methyl-accepting chemotaxis protein
MNGTDNIDEKTRGIQEVTDDNSFNQDVVNINPGDEVSLIESLQREMSEKSAAETPAATEDHGDFSFDESSDDESPAVTLKKKSDSKGLDLFLDIIRFFLPPVLAAAAVVAVGYLLDSTSITIISASVLALLIGLYFFILFRIRINRRMKFAEEVLTQISRGKLGFDVLHDQKLAARLGLLAVPVDKVIKEISEMVTKVELSALDLSGNSNALKYFAQSMAKKTDDQAGSINMIDNSAKSLNESMQSIRHNVESAYDISKISILEADTSSVEILSLIEEMNTINDMSDKIITTMNFIDDIADETNLLALNASIQAAHAGEEGKGFGVVADEIRNLAESSSKATKSIYQIIEKTIESIQKGVMASEKAKKALNKIVSLIKSTEDIMARINESINQQSQTTSGLKESVENIQELTKNINSDTQNMESAIGNLSGQADILTALISMFETHSSSIKSDAIYGVDSDGENEEGDDLQITAGNS